MLVSAVVNLSQSFRVERRFATLLKAIHMSCQNVDAKLFYARNSLSRIFKLSG